MKHAVVALVLFTFSSIAAAAPTSTHLATPVVEIPMDLSTKHIAVEVSINGEGPFPFNLDTYAVTTACVDRAFVKRMGLKKVGTTMNGDGSGEHRRLDVVLIPEIQVGGATFTNVRALVDDYSWVETPDGGSIDGLLGYHLFRGLLLELDYPNERVILRTGDLDHDDVHVVSHRALRHTPDFPVMIGDRRITVGIDTGAPSSLSLPSSFLSTLDLVGEPRVAGRAKTVYSEAEVLQGMLADPLTIAGHDHGETAATFSELFGRPLVGHDLLMRYSVTFDQKNGRVRFRAPEAKSSD